MKPEVKLGVLIEGTMRPVDTIPAMFNEAVRRELDPWRIITAASEQWAHAEEMQLGRALKVRTPEDKDSIIIAIHDHDWWNKDLDNGHGWTSHEENQQVWQELVDLLNEDLEGMTFGTHPDDPACLGYWENNDTDQ